MPRNPPWSREELILALDLYVTIGQAGKNNPEVIALSGVLNALATRREGQRSETYRNPAGVGMKLGNLAALDPAYPGVGLRRGNRLEAKIWDEFTDDPELLRREAAALRSSIAPLPQTPRDRRYWTLRARQDLYRVEDAVRELQTDLWVTRGSDIRAGDRVAIWKLKGRSNTHGVIALGEVLTGPRDLADLDNPFWVDAERATQVEPRVRVRYVLPPNVPLWLPHPLLDDFNAAKAHGGTVFVIDDSEWRGLMEVVGGWPSPEAEEALDAIARLAGRRDRGQRFATNPELRKAIEDHAMKMATEHFLLEGWEVENVSRYESFDLRCLKDGQEKHVEVKGTTSDGSQVMLTYNEVEHARQFHQVVLFIVAGIEHASRAKAKLPEVQGGLVTLYDPWNLVDEALRPISFTYTVINPSEDV